MIQGRFCVSELKEGKQCNLKKRLNELAIMVECWYWDCRILEDNFSYPWEWESKNRIWSLLQW